MTDKTWRAIPGEPVRLRSLPVGFLNDLPAGDQAAIKRAVGRLVTFVAYDDDGRAEIEFEDQDGTKHSLFLTSNFIAPAT